MRSLIEIISQRRRQILVHSYLYYQLNTNVVSDCQYDKWMKELVELQKKYPDESAKSAYADEFKGFDGSTGFDLPFIYPEIQTAGLSLLKEHKRRTNN
ncbi:hypothetical protein OH542_21375 [Bacillus velezensis]|uniref:DNA ligase LigA-related protein n=1 Tax=Bacillus velezensis TaxID=492670 RepID=UPI0020B16EA9|nr:hypothetical protein [Bacillus velezensis]MCV4329250.1 hypothetical protein [Bacillus velezensis]